MNATQPWLAEGRLSDRDAYNDTQLGIAFLRPGDSLPYHIIGHRRASAGAFAAVADSEALGLCRQQRVVIDGRIVFVAVRTAVPALPQEEIAA